MFEDDLALQRDDGQREVTKEVIARCRHRAKLMLTKLREVNPKQYAMVMDRSSHVAGICPRRAGKSYAGAAHALITGEATPGSISLIISLNKQQLRRIYWSGGPSGLYMMARKFNLKLEFNNTYLRWEHENGSIGYLLGCEDDEQMEVIRGLEADLYLVDECKSFAPGKLAKLIDQIIDPQLSSRDGKLLLIGTPGFIAMGPFYQATCPQSLDSDGMPYSIPAGVEKDAWGRTANDDLLWSLHSWTLQDNTAKPKQWIDALRKKKSKKWADDHPIWLREYLGLWTSGGDGLVFAYADEKRAGRCTWVPEQTAENPTGLPQDGNWRLVAGLDFGYEAPTAMVLAAYSRKYGELRHVWDFSGRHMVPHEISNMIKQAEKRFGRIEMIFADVGNLGKTIAQDLIETYGHPIEAAKKREKFDYIEQLNGAFQLGEVFIIPNTALEVQLLTNAWDLDEVDEDQLPKGRTVKEEMGRLEKLVEDDSIPNDSTDALLYLFRGSLHRFGRISRDTSIEVGSPAWIEKQEVLELAQLRKQLKAQSDRDHFLGNNLPQMPPGLQNAFKKKDIWSQSTLITSKPSLRS